MSTGLSPFFVGPMKEGLVKATDPFFLPNDAYEVLFNCYVWRDRLRRRPGTRFLVGAVDEDFQNALGLFLLSRLRLSRFIGEAQTVSGSGDTQAVLSFREQMTDAMGNTAALSPIGFGSPYLGQLFSVGNVLFALREPPPGETTSDALVTTTDDSQTSATLRLDMGANTIQISGAPPSTRVYWYPSTPCLSLQRQLRISPTSQGDVGPSPIRLIAFDRNFAYRLSTDAGAAWNSAIDRYDTDESPNDAHMPWRGGDLNQASTENFLAGTNREDRRVSLWIVNNNAADGIRILYPQSESANILYRRKPALRELEPQTRLSTARVIKSFKNRLLVFNTVEVLPDGSERRFPSRVRWSATSTLLTQEVDLQPSVTPLDPLAWYHDRPGLGGFRDLSLEEEIVAVEEIKDRIIIFCLRSTWEMVRISTFTPIASANTGRTLTPFAFNLLNNELGAASTFSVVGFDKFSVVLGERGIHACDGASVKRMDVKLLERIFRFRTERSLTQRVVGAKDYNLEMVYWSYPAAGSLLGATAQYSPTPNRILAYNYRNDTWAQFTESWTSISSTQQDRNEFTWAEIPYPTWTDWCRPWEGDLTSQPAIMAGNQQGMTFFVDPDSSVSAPSLLVSDIVSTGAEVRIVCPNHNLEREAYVRLSGFQGDDFDKNGVFQVVRLVDSNHFVLDRDFTPLAGPYTGRVLVHRMEIPEIITKQFSLFADKGIQMRVVYVDWLFQKTPMGRVLVETMVESDNFPIVPGVSLGANSSELGTTTLLTSVGDNEVRLGEPPPGRKIWRRFHLYSQGPFVQFRITLGPRQIKSQNIFASDFVLFAFVLYAKPEGRIIG